MVFPAIAGHPAVDLLNTRPVRAGGPTELLTSFGCVVRWAVTTGLLTRADAERLRSQDLEVPGAADRIVEARERLRTYLEQPRSKAARTALRSSVDQLLSMRTGTWRLRLQESGFACDFVPRVEKPRDLLGAVGFAIADFLGSGALERIKRCASNDCVLWFLDGSRNGSRHWCSMRTCGSRAKAATYYGRQRGRARGADPLDSDGSAGPPRTTLKQRRRDER